MSANKAIRLNSATTTTLVLAGSTEVLERINVNTGGAGSATVRYLDDSEVIAVIDTAAVASFIFDLASGGRGIDLVQTGTAELTALFRQ